VKSHHRRVRGAGAGADSDPSIDEIYGLEPLFEPAAATGGDAPGEGVRLQRVECPYCGESFETQVDTSSGSTCYIEDCQVCCQPIEFTIEVDDTGALSAVTLRRSDD
jgi:hypothetical protein